MSLSPNFSYRPGQVNSLYIIKRPLQTLDEVGKVPIVGSIVAIARIVLGGVMSLYAGMKWVSSGSSFVKLSGPKRPYTSRIHAKYWYKIQVKCGLHEVARGMVELLPTLINIIEWKATRDKALLNKDKADGVHCILGVDWLARKNMICIDPKDRLHYFTLKDVNSRLTLQKNPRENPQANWEWQRIDGRYFRKDGYYYGRVFKDGYCQGHLNRVLINTTDDISDFLIDTVTTVPSQPS